MAQQLHHRAVDAEYNGQHAAGYAGQDSTAADQGALQDAHQHQGRAFI
ncbi:hypothetical protein SDC9_207343 [bioreactor metagenome]|uniref:Uncharacterized protein n=1 Tax=bioreactor metagenome TaxID=1076179 RepID=A0A645J929_9ZZZZ